MGTVTFQPVRRYGVPAYPTKLSIAADPALLRQHVPSAWLSQREIAAAAGALLAMQAAGCARDAGSGAGSWTASGGSSGRPAVVAPVFEYGKGQDRSRFALACSAVASPVYLPEEEALRVIAEELARAGLTVSARNVEFPAVTIRGRECHEGYSWVAGGWKMQFADVTGPLEADFLIDAQRIVVEYVARDDFDRLGGNDEGQWSMDIKGVATSVGREVEQQGRGFYFGAFYDPVVWDDDFHEPPATAVQAWERTHEGATTPEEEEAKFRAYMRLCDEAAAKARAEASARAQELLRQQVRDFVDWLKAQGVI